MANTPTSGSRLLLGTQATDAATDTYQLVGKIQQLGDFGGTVAEVTALTLEDSAVQKTIGSSDEGNLNPQFIYDGENVGQQALITAAQNQRTSPTPYNIKIELNDTPPSGAAPTPTTYIYKGLIRGAPLNIGQGDNFVLLNTQISLTQLVSRTPRATGD
ncbi:MAG: hypothetical protein AAFQ81_09305 [Pseudomonadota bacterium]